MGGAVHRCFGRPAGVPRRHDLHDRPAPPRPPAAGAAGGVVERGVGRPVRRCSRGPLGHGRAHPPGIRHVGRGVVHLAVAVLPPPAVRLRPDPHTQGLVPGAARRSPERDHRHLHHPRRALLPRQQPGREHHGLALRTVVLCVGRSRAGAESRGQRRPAAGPRVRGEKAPVRRQRGHARPVHRTTTVGTTTVATRRVDGEPPRTREGLCRLPRTGAVPARPGRLRPRRADGA